MTEMSSPAAPLPIKASRLFTVEARDSTDTSSVSGKVSFSKVCEAGLKNMLEMA
ncbi:hypothetical protein D3C73_1494030 [compost metagenome]